jgi:hypothetical protein
MPGDRFAVPTMKPGHVMQTRDGRSILKGGNDLARLDRIRKCDLGAKYWPGLPCWQAPPPHG